MVLARTGLDLSLVACWPGPAPHCSTTVESVWSVGLRAQRASEFSTYELADAAPADAPSAGKARQPRGEATRHPRRSHSHGPGSLVPSLLAVVVAARGARLASRVGLGDADRRVHSGGQISAVAAVSPSSPPTRQHSPRPASYASISVISTDTAMSSWSSVAIDLTTAAIGTRRRRHLGA